MHLSTREVYSFRQTIKEEKDDSSTKCRERRRQRIEMRRLTTISVTGSSFLVDTNGGDNYTEGITDPTELPTSSGEDAEALFDSSSDTVILR
ncbi:protein-serine,threonine phosphatase [Sarracenia purpurea var. burkii]